MAQHSIGNVLKYGIPIDTTGAYTTPSRFATNMIIQFGDHHVVLNFFEAKSWIIPPGTEAEQKDFIDDVNLLPAECVARLIVTPEMIETLAQELASAAETIRNYKEHLYQQRKADHGD